MTREHRRGGNAESHVRLGLEEAGEDRHHVSTADPLEAVDHLSALFLAELVIARDRDPRAIGKAGGDGEFVPGVDRVAQASRNGGRVVLDPGGEPGPAPLPELEKDGARLAAVLLAVRFEERDRSVGDAPTERLPSLGIVHCQLVGDRNESPRHEGRQRTGERRLRELPPRLAENLFA